MPNWCECDLTVRGPAARVREFLSYAKGADQGEPLPFDFNRFIPYPERFEALDRAASEWDQKHKPGEWESRPSDGFNSGGYGWCIANWGTKWNARHAEEPESKEEAGVLEVTLRFDTAWSAPAPVVRKASETYPDLLFELRYAEYGMDFSGRYVTQGGRVLIDECGPFPVGEEYEPF